MASINGLQEVLGGVINSGAYISVALSVGSPKDDDFIKAVVCFKCTIINVSIWYHVTGDRNKRMLTECHCGSSRRAQPWSP